MGDPDGQTAGPLVEPLTRREREILALLAQGLSAPEIAEKLTLAVSSVKWHIQQLYGKLGVNSKQKALVRAGELGLLETAPAISGPGRSVAFGPMRPAAQQPEPPAEPRPLHNLPLQVTQFFGREAEIEQLRQRVAAHRLVTLSGSGGVGKTRLSLQTAEQVLGDFADGVWLIELAPLTDPVLVPQNVAAILGVRDERGRPALDTLTAYLRERQILLVLDNCEHLLEACARLAEALLRACPRLRLLASSREPLGIPGEAVFPIPSLPFPDPAQALSLESLRDYASVRLFVDRARMVLPRFELAAHNAAAVTRICQRLDGIPLAIEMAAARLNVLNAEQLAGRLDDVFRLLTGGSRTALPRQQTLRAMIDWSYKLLTDDERLLLQRLSVFAGGWLLEAAEVVCADPPGEGIDGGQVLELLGALVAKSLVIADRLPGQEPRYHLLETVRQYAREKLQDADDTARLHRQHRDYFLAYAEAVSLKGQSEEQFSWGKPLEVEVENIRLALHWSFDDPSHPEAGPRLALVAGMPTHAEGFAWYRTAIVWCQAHPEISGHLQAQVFQAAAGFQSLDDPPGGLIWANQAVEISRRLGPDGQERLMWSVFHLAGLYEQCDEAEQALAPFAEAQSILNSLASDRYTPTERLRVDGYFALAHAAILNRLGRFQEAKMRAGEGMRLYEESGSWWFGRGGLIELTIACVNLAEYDQARGYLAEVRRLGDEDYGYNLRWLAMLELREGNLKQAIQRCQESIRLADPRPDRNIIASGLGILANVWARFGHADRAAQLAGASQAMYTRQRRKPWEDSSLDTLFPGWREGPDQAALSEAFAAGQAMTTEQAVALALAESSA